MYYIIDLGGLSHVGDHMIGELVHVFFEVFNDLLNSDCQRLGQFLLIGLEKDSSNPGGGARVIRIFHIQVIYLGGKFPFVHNLGKDELLWILKG